MTRLFAILVASVLLGGCGFEAVTCLELVEDIERCDLRPANLRCDAISLDERLRGPQALAALESGRADIAVGARWRPGSLCKRTPLAKIGFVLAVPKGHRLASRTAVTLKDLKDERLILPPHPSQHRELITTQLDALQVPWQLGVEAPGWQLMLHLVQSKLGVAIVNDFCVMPRTVRAIPLSGLPAIQYEVCTPKGALRPGTRRFLELLD